ncbi:DUF397 domain-containing protein [Streptomyces thermodiastaticus]|uniref:DUF397 domain-containing protein n=1 Tax=Streptomyces thermodiastaticus TaxID=44061 RepID=UPI00167ADAFD|nr:DUF397 domain-containing protein [Streptomyces thermodiastaticus]MCE7548883.1 DUF397 domain-containing protein [Streptomyces thermodiastaticus]GHF75105.1 hypothetical protein GCM10018787_24650 [Streptomyces thermodiastaticus]
MSVRAAQVVPEAAWFKSSYSTGGGGECVEVATVTDVVHVRDTKRPTEARLSFGPAAWACFVRMAAGR